MNKDRAKGRSKKVKGNAKKAAGKATGNKDLERDGKVDNAKGKYQAKIGDRKNDVKKLI